MEKAKPFIYLIAFYTVVMLFLWFSDNKEPILSEDPEVYTCCSEERLISIYEGLENLEQSAQMVKDSIDASKPVNNNAMVILQMWEDSLKNDK